jgi:hypothetical protein
MTDDWFCYLSLATNYLILTTKYSLLVVQQASARLADGTAGGQILGQFI